jgi:hypothetical protein
MVSFTPRPLYSKETVAGTQVGPTAGLYAMAKKKIPAPARNQIPDIQLKA